MERRFFPLDLDNVEIRAKKDGSGYTFRGHASVFDSWSQDLGGFVERVSPTAFTRALQRPPENQAVQAAGSGAGVEGIEAARPAR